jgi:hypothetical protein
MTNLLERYLKWRRKVFPASKEDVAWRFEALVNYTNYKVSLPIYGKC